MTKQPTERATETGGPAAVWVRLSELKTWDSNPRKNDAAVDAVAKSIAAFGFGSPILARKENGEVIAGHTRLKAAEKLKLTVVPVRYLDISADDAHLLAIADNKTNELSDWDDEQLAAVLVDMRHRQIDIRATGFKDDELEQLIGAVEVDSLMLDPTSDHTAIESTNYLCFRKYKIPLSRETAERVQAIVTEYIGRNGSMHGLAEELLDGSLKRTTDA